MTTKDESTGKDTTDIKIENIILVKTSKGKCVAQVKISSNNTLSDLRQSLVNTLKDTEFSNGFAFAHSNQLILIKKHKENGLLVKDYTPSIAIIPSAIVQQPMVITSSMQEAAASNNYRDEQANANGYPSLGDEIKIFEIESMIVENQIHIYVEERLRRMRQVNSRNVNNSAFCQFISRATY